jgi:hypothetical protein
MSPWPGAPANQQTPPINAPSVRYPSNLSEKSSMADVAEAVQTAFDGLAIHEQAFASLPAQVASQAQTAATAAIEQITSETTNGVTSFNSQTGAIIFFPSLGQVNDQMGNPVYLTTTADAGRKIVVGDSTPVTVNLNTAVTLPWFAMIGNDSSAVASFVTDSSATIIGLSALNQGGFAFIFFDGSTFWSEGVPGGPTGVIPLGPLTDSGMTGSISVVNGLIQGWVSPT